MAQANQLQVIKQTLSTPAMVAQVKAALPPHVTPDKFLRTAMTVLSQNPDLVKCKRESLMASIMSAASVGLLPESYMGQCYLIPFKGQATLQIGYKGMLELARRSGEIVSINSGVAYEKDTKIIEQGMNTKLEIHPFLDGDPGPAVLVWCVVHLKDGGHQIEWKTVDAIEKIRKGSPSANSPAWKNHWDAMARKVVIKSCLKYCPQSVELQQALAMDDQIDMGVVANVTPEGDMNIVPFEQPGDEGKKPAAKKKAAPKRKSRLQQMADQEPPADNEPPIADEHGNPVDMPDKTEEGATIDQDTGEVL